MHESIALKFDRASVRRRYHMIKEIGRCRASEATFRRRAEPMLATGLCSRAVSRWRRCHRRVQDSLAPTTGLLSTPAKRAELAQKAFKWRTRFSQDEPLSRLGHPASIPRTYIYAQTQTCAPVSASPARRAMHSLFPLPSQNPASRHRPCHVGTQHSPLQISHPWEYPR